MKRSMLLKTALTIALGLTLSGCVAVKSPVVPPIGTLYNQTAFPVDITYGPNEIGSQSGSAKACSILSLVAWGDCSVETAAKNGGLKQVDHVDASLFNVLGVYQVYETTAFGK